MGDTVLSVENVTVNFGGLTAVSNVSFQIRPGEIVGLIGPNGAGKTSLIKAIMGVARPDVGRIVLGDIDVSGMKTAKRCNLGLAMSHQIVRPFRNMTILENVMLAAGKDITRSPITSLFSFQQEEQRRRALDVLKMVQIAELADASAAKQPLGILKRLEVARALALKPLVLLLDEPLAGIGHGETGPIADLLISLNKAGVTILLVEHNLVEARRICPRFIVLDNGRKIADGPTDEVMGNQDVIAAYIGKDPNHA